MRPLPLLPEKMREAEPFVIVDIAHGTHIVCIPINDEGDFAAIPAVFRDGNPDHQFLDRMPHGGVLINDKKI